MKKAHSLIKKQAIIAGMFGLIAVLFISCIKNNDNNDVTAPPAALISVVNASPGTQPLDFYLDENKTNVQAISYGSGLDYLRAYTGKRTATFYLAGTRQTVKSDTATLQADRFYTLYLTNVSTAPDFLLLRDSIARPASGMTAIRLVNVSASAPAVDLAIKSGQVLATNKAYKGFSSFVSIQGGNTYTLEVRQAGTTTVLATINDIQLKGNSVYTVWLQGVASATDATMLTAKIQTNAYYN
ncbi:DUF4397 domain-containing protein [Mucilaginibacter terrae]|uniref:DUF4397 domain-containing protein n=1 Tax=Mucilaginibacter terrae TaxID=1955052 RepID=UPI0036293B7A